MASNRPEDRRKAISYIEQAVDVVRDNPEIEGAESDVRSRSRHQCARLFVDLEFNFRYIRWTSASGYLPCPIMLG